MDVSKTVFMPTRKKLAPETVGFLYSLYSAGFYTLANLAQRGLTDYRDLSVDWTLAFREVPSIVILGGFILVRTLRGKYRFPSLKVILALLLAGASCMLFGARMHLKAFEYAGISLATPLIQASTLIISSLIGALFLKERATKSRYLSIALLIVAVWLIYGGGATGTIAGKEARLGLGVLACVGTALGYCVQLSLVRKHLQIVPNQTLLGVYRDATTDNQRAAAPIVPTTLAIIAVSFVGVFGNGGIFAYQHGFSALFNPPAAECWVYVFVAGIAHIFALGFEIASLRRLFLLKQAIVATVNAAIVYVLGVVLFDEPFELRAALGVVLIMTGVIVSSKSK